LERHDWRLKLLADDTAADNVLATYRRRVARPAMWCRRRPAACGAD